MALVHYVHVAHFIPEDGFVRFQDNIPVSSRPLNMGVVEMLLRKHLGEVASTKNFPDEFGLSVFPDRIVFDKLGSPRAVLHFAADYAELERATILDLGSFTLLTPAQLRQDAAFNPAP
jgi:hypothetical protein